MIYFLVVGAPPYRGFNGCFLMHVGRDLLLLWVLLLIWDACRYNFIIKGPSSDWENSIVNAHVGTCHPRM